MFSRLKKTISQVFSFVALFVCSQSVTAGNPSAPTVLLEYDQNPATVVFAFSEIFPEFADQDRTPLLRIYGDGRMLVYYPNYLKQAGQYEGYLTTFELESLLQEVAPIILGFSTSGVKRQKKNAQYEVLTQAQALQELTLFFESDMAISNFHMNIKSYQSSGLQKSTFAGTGIDVSWNGLQFDAKNYPTVKPIQNLMKMEQMIKTLTKKKDLRRLRP